MQQSIPGTSMTPYSSYCLHKLSSNAPLNLHLLFVYPIHLLTTHQQQIKWSYTLQMCIVLSVSLSLSVSLCLSLSLSLSLCVSVCLSVCLLLSWSLSVSLCLSLCLSVTLCQQQIKWSYTLQMCIVL